MERRKTVSPAGGGVAEGDGGGQLTSFKFPKKTGNPSKTSPKEKVPDESGT